MRHILEAGTDGACIAIFDASALPKDFDDRAQDDPRGAAEDAQDEGKCFINDTGGDGSHILHVYLDDSLPPSLAAASSLVRKIESFAVPGGRLWFTGAEYLCRDDFLEPTETVTEACVEIPKGDYAASLFEIDSEKVDAPVDPAKEFSFQERALRVLRPIMLLLAVVALALTVRALFRYGLRLETLWPAIVFVAASAGMYWLGNSPTLRHADQRARDIQREHFPNFALILTPRT